MKKYLPLLRIFLAVAMAGLIFNACDPHTDPTCRDPIQEYPFPSNASRWLFGPLKIGDTIKFKVYHRTNRSSPYVYRKDESFVLKDTMIKKIQQKNTYSAINCNSQMIGDFLVADFKGSESLQYQLSDDVSTNLIIYLGKEEFDVDVFQYNSHTTGWLDSAVIGGQKFLQIKIFAGGEIGSQNYIDSTFCFYNLQYGALKFIVNDTLIYQRKLK